MSSQLEPGFPNLRLRRLRQHPVLRNLVRETTLTVHDFILPLFVRPGRGVRKEIPSMPGNYQLSVDTLVDEVGAAAELGVRAFILFGIPEHKDATGTSAGDEEGIVQQSLRALRAAYKDILLITDECFCEYTDHGHCGVLSTSRGRTDVDNDATLPIMSYAAKYASAFYGPFRDAAESPPQFGDRSGYQMDPANGDEALREVALDLSEGADIVMVKPALAYMDVIRRVKDRFGVPVAAYNVSGEFAMVKAAAQKGWLDERRTALEILTGIKRAGADMILTYYARDAARWLR